MATAIDGQRAAVDDVIYKQRYQLFGVLSLAIVIRAVGYHRRQTVGVVIGAHEVVRRCLRCRVGRVGVVACSFGELIVAKTQSAIHLIGRDVVKASASLTLHQKTNFVKQQQESKKH